MKDFAPRDLVAGALLVVLVVAATVFVDSDRAVFEDEAVVLAAISAVAPAEENCDISYGLNSDEIVINSEFDRPPGTIPGLSHADDTIKTVLIYCWVSDDVHWATWDQWGVWFRLRVRYPLKSGSHAEEVNDLIRRDVAAMISQYLINARDRLNSGGGTLTGVPDDSSARYGFLEIDGIASLMNDSLYSVGLYSSAHDPDSNTSENYLRTLNYDLVTGERFRLTDFLHPSRETLDALVTLAYFGDPWFDVSSRKFRHGEIGEVLREQEFTLTADAFVLHCTWDCNKGIAPVQMMNGWDLEIRYGDFADYLDPDGPYRHILNN